MKRLTTALIVLLTTLTVSAGQPHHSKLSAWLQETIKEQQTPRRAASQKDLLTTVFLQFNEPISDETLAEYGAKRYAQLEDIAIVTVPLGKVSALAELGGVERIEANQLAHPTMDTIPKLVDLLPAYQTTTEHPAFTGDGVVVGLMDIGFDLTHPTFYNNTALSHYRIKAFWDQLAPSTDRERLPVGCDWTTEGDILGRGCATDGQTEQHGTHTAGIAAGSGYDAPFRGVAFNSDICLVANAVTTDTMYIPKDDLYLYTSATDALGFKYLFDYAEQQGKPCVVSFSEGYTPYMDEDDLLFSRFLSMLTGPGRILVVSAGNESREPTFIEKPRGTAAAGSFIRVYRKNARYRMKADGPMAISLYGYASGSTPTHHLRITSDRFETEANASGALADTLFFDKDTCAVNVSRYTLAFGQGETVYEIVLRSNRDLSLLPHIAIVAEGAESHVEVFGSSANLLSNDDTDTRWNGATYGHNILAPGCFGSPITVGSTSHRLAFTNAQGKVISNTKGQQPDKVSWFSSTGPTMDGLMKPDVVAPGEYVISSLSSYYLEQHPQGDSWDYSYFDCQGRTYVWGLVSGTSMSTPVVAGTIALWLQARPELTREDIMGVIERTSRHPDNSLTYPNNLYGYGEIDAYRGLLDVLGIATIEGISQHQPQQARLYFRDGMLHVLFGKTPTKPLRLTVYATNGTQQYQTTLTGTQQEVAITLPHMASGIYAVQLTGDAATTGSQLIRIE